MYSSSPSRAGFWETTSPVHNQGMKSRKTGYTDNYGSSMRNRVSPAFKTPPAQSSHRTFSYDDDQRRTPSNRQQFRAYQNPPERLMSPTIHEHDEEIKRGKKTSYACVLLLMTILLCLTIIGVVNIYETIKEKNIHTQTDKRDYSSSSAVEMSQDVKKLKRQLEQSKNTVKKIDTNLNVLRNKIDKEKVKNQNKKNEDTNRENPQQTVDNLSLQLQNLQIKIQDHSTKSVLERFGIGPYRVQFNLNLPASLFSEKDGNSFVLEMADLEYQPIAVFTFLTQVADGLWDHDNASIYRNAIHLLQIQSDISKNEEHMPFEELPHADFTHGLYTVGYASKGGSWFIDLKSENKKIHEKLPCFAKVIQGHELITKIHESIPTDHDAEQHDYIFEPIQITNAFILKNEAPHNADSIHQKRL